MKKPPQIRKRTGRGLKVGIVASRYNQQYVDGMLKGAKSTLKQAGASEVRVVRVPGAFEIPLAASLLASQGYDAVICLGLIWQGETPHAQHLGEVVTGALMEIQLRSGVPTIHEVLQIATAEQARVRCLDPKLNRGIEAARTALEMANLTRQLGGRENVEN